MTTPIDFNRLDMRRTCGWSPSGEQCPCGSGEQHYRVFDSRGIYLTLGCEKCLTDRLSGFRADVLYGPTYEADEPIEPEADNDNIAYGMDV